MTQNDKILFNSDKLILGDHNVNFLAGTDESDWIEGLAGNDILKGGAGNDYINAGSGNDWVVGGLGNDIFHFEAGDQDVKIGDWEIGVDKIVLANGLKFEDLTKSTSVYNGVTTTVFTTSNADRLMLKNVMCDDIGAEDFLTISDSTDNPNKAPIPQVASFAGVEDSLIEGTLFASDPDGDALTFHKASDPANGTVTVYPDGTFNYLPDQDFTGEDNFEYQVADSNGGTQIATVTVTVKPLNYFFSPSNYANVFLDDQSLNIFKGSDDDDWVDGLDGNDVLKGGAGDDYIKSGSGADWVVGGSGNDIFHFEVGDQSVKIGDWQSGEDKILLANGLTFDDLTKSISVYNGVTTTVFTTSSFDRLMFKNVLFDDIGADDFLTVEDVTENNDPVPQSISVVGAEDSSIDGTLSATDPDGDPLTFQMATIPANGTVSIRPDGVFSYRPEKDFLGRDSFEYQVSDPNGGLETGSVFVTVTPKSEDPILTAFFNSGQSLKYATASTSIEMDPVQGLWTVDWLELSLDSNGPKLQDLTQYTSLGLVPFQNNNREVDGRGIFHGFEDEMVYVTNAAGGKTLEWLSSGVAKTNMREQINAMVDGIEASGASLGDTVFFSWEQGQADTSTSIETYKQDFLSLVAQVDEVFDEAAGRDVDLVTLITQVRSYSQGKPSQAQYELIEENESIHFAGYEAYYQFRFPATSQDTTHLSGEGQYEKGKVIGDIAAKILVGEAPTLAKANVTSIGNLLTVDFTGLNGDLRILNGDEYFKFSAAPGNDLGVGVFSSGSRHSGHAPEIVDAKLIDQDTIEFTLTKALDNQTSWELAIGRPSDNGSHGHLLADDIGMLPFQYAGIEVF